jgi:hypothetical protein
MHPTLQRVVSGTIPVNGHSTKRKNDASRLTVNAGPRFGAFSVTRTLLFSLSSGAPLLCHAQATAQLPLVPVRLRGQIAPLPSNNSAIFACRRHKEPLVKERSFSIRTRGTQLA